MLLLAAVDEELGGLTGEIIGVGPVVAAARAAVAIERWTPSAVLLIGSAGAYPGGPAVGRAVAAARVGLGAGAAALGLAYVPRSPPPIHADPDLLARLDLPRCDVLTVGAITTDLGLVAALGAGWQVEHMEAYGVAVACQDRGVPFLAVLGIANHVGPDAHTQWLLHRERAHEAVLEAVRPLLGA